ncbi:3-deoxy-D-manno-octulosonic acid transferase [Pseudooceanicola atlanticus]|uniref:3-deoxy-D-manno-octulosonic acid transferase n=1 Tax=Pseudooceanicola atlanticus TaxID=1461694 RepID=UPI0005C21F56|nr:glycosyltransferase N-terminal domain-containing protein [Pseudooceanicola atlanticus]
MPSASRRAPGAIGSGEDLPPRPEGPLIWAHAADPDRAPALAQLAVRAAGQWPDITMVMTQCHDQPIQAKLPRHVIPQQLPDDNTAPSRKFLAHWQPDICIWHTGHLRPTLLNQTLQKGVPTLLIDATEDGFPEQRLRWSRRGERNVITGFEAIFARSANAAKRLTRLGANPEKIDVTGPLQEGAAAIPCNEAERTELAESLATRPIWLAAMVQADELNMVIEAHRRAIRSAHRLMLILVPQDIDSTSAMVAELEAQGLRYVRWSAGGYPEETTQVLLADTYGEMGLWYRLAPVTLMASSLTTGHGGRDPYEPAALGSAIVYGPNVSRHLSSYSRFARAGAARLVRDAPSLAAAILRLNAPDQAAAMAQAAWDVATEGAEVTDKVLEKIEEILDRRSLSNAGA